MTTANFDLQRVQRWRKAAVAAGLLLALGLVLLTQSYGGETVWHQNIERIGMALIVVCIVGRAWCSLYIGGRKKAEIVDRGPYSISRNPLYVFSYLGAFGVGAQTGSVTLAIVFTVITMLIFHVTILREEAWLRAEFGQPYVDYLARAPRYGPDFSAWRDADSITVKPRFFLVTLRDGLVFLLAFPLFEAVEVMQQQGWLPILAQLP